MKKTNNKGYMLIETLIVSTFVAGILLFLFIQFSNLNKNYNDAFKYNTVDGLYALEDIKNYILQDISAYNKIKENISINDYIDIIDCSLFTNKKFCEELVNLENIEIIYVTNNYFKSDINVSTSPSISTNFLNTEEDFNIFIDKINPSGDEEYRLIAKFKNNTFATIRFGE